MTSTRRVSSIDINLRDLAWKPFSFVVKVLPTLFNSSNMNLIYIYGLTVVELCAPMNYIMDRLLHVHYNLLQKTFTYERVLCDLSLFLYYKLHVTVHFGYILSTCINILAHRISWYISMEFLATSRYLLRLKEEVLNGARMSKLLA